MAQGYRVVVRVSVRHWWLSVVGGLALALLALVFVTGVELPLPAWAAQTAGVPRLVLKPMGQELVPSEDQSRFVVNVICPVGSSIDYVDEMLMKTEAVIVNLRDPKDDSEVVASMFAAVSIRPGSLISEGIVFVRLVPGNKRSWTQTQLIAEARKRLSGIPGMRVIVLDLSTQGFTPTRGYPIDFAVQGPDWDTVTTLSERIRQRITDSGIVTDVNSDYRPGMTEYHVTPDRNKLGDVALPIQRMAFTLNVAFGGVRSGRFTDLDKRYDVRLRLLEPQRQSPDQLDELYVKTDRGRLVPLSDIAERRAVSTLPIINRYNHLRKVEITANMAPGVSQGEAIARCRAIAEETREEMGLPPSYRIVQLGNAQAMKQTLDSMWWALFLGFIIAYMILGVQFNSFVHPFTVLLAVPFGVTGALAMLWYCGDTLNLMSMIGMVLLAGLVKKNSIILVDYANQLRKMSDGVLSPEQAMLLACPVRLRPIVMTTLATIAAAVPLALGYGPGAETRAPLARSIIGGIFLSTLVTLVIVPVFYVKFEHLGAWLSRQARRGS